MKRIITVYHGIGINDKFMEVELDEFKEQITYLKKKNYTFCTVSEILKSTGGKKICVMFDDGLSSSYVALKYLEKNNIKYSLALIENNIGKNGYLTLKQLSKLKNAELCFHTKNHTDLTKLNSDQLKEELNIKNAILKSNILVYPMGQYNSKTIKIMHDMKYKYGLTVLPFHIPSNSNNYEIPRICINGYQSNFKYKFFLTKLGNIYLHLAFIKRKILNQSYLER